MKVRIEIRPSDFEGNACCCCHKDESRKKGTTDDRRRTTDFILFMVYKMEFPKMEQTCPESLSSVVCRPSSSFIIYVIHPFPASIPNNKRNYETFTPLLHPSAFGYNRF